MIRQRYQESYHLASCGIMIELGALNIMSLLVVPMTIEVMIAIAVTFVSTLVSGAMMLLHRLARARTIQMSGVVLTVAVLTIPLMLQAHSLGQTTLLILGTSVFVVLVSCWMWSGK